MNWTLRFDVYGRTKQEIDERVREQMEAFHPGSSGLWEIDVDLRPVRSTVGEILYFDADVTATWRVR